LWWKGVLNGAKLVERILEFDRQQLGDDSGDRIERQSAACELHLARRRDDVRLVARVHDEGLTVNVDDRLQQRRDEIHFIHRIAQVGATHATRGPGVPACVSA
jgi:hypothetical protein